MGEVHLYPRQRKTQLIKHCVATIADKWGRSGKVTAPEGLHVTGKYRTTHDAHMLQVYELDPHTPKGNEV